MEDINSIINSLITNKNRINSIEKTNALVMSLGDPSGDPRPKRIIDFLISEGWDVDVLSYPIQACKMGIRRHFIIKNQYTETEQNEITDRILRKIKNMSEKLFRMLVPLNGFRNWLNSRHFSLERIQKELQSRHYNLIICEDLQLLPLASELKQRGKLLFDAREYYPAQNEESLKWRLFERPERIRLCETYLSQCDFAITVSSGIAEEYKKVFGVDMEIVMSTPLYNNKLKPKTINEKNIRLVHHGAANPNRKLENMLDILKQLPKQFTLDCYLKGTREYIEFLKIYASDDPRIRIMNPVAFEDIISTLNHYDIGLFFNNPTTFNLKNSLPNKLFEFIQSRLAVAIGPSPNMAEIVNQYKCGIVSDTFNLTSMVGKLNLLTYQEINQYKQNSHIASKELCWEKESKKMLKIVNSMNTKIKYS